MLGIVSNTKSQTIFMHRYLHNNTLLLKYLIPHELFSHPLNLLDEPRTSCRFCIGTFQVHPSAFAYHFITYQSYTYFGVSVRPFACLFALNFLLERATKL
jgi:hypothetical protein